jgi:hypothetical protein
LIDRSEYFLQYNRSPEVIQRKSEWYFSNQKKFKQRMKERYLQNREKELEKARLKHKLNYVPKKLISKKCKFCNKIFAQNTTTQVFCSRTCGDAFHRNKNYKLNIEYKQKWYQENKKRIGQHQLLRYHQENKLNTIMRLRGNVIRAFNAYSKSGKVKPSKEYNIDYKKIFQYIGECPGKKSEWHIDHKVPLSVFNFDNPDEVKIAFAPSNHQWLPKKVNLAKSNKINPQLSLRVWS